MFWTKVLRGKKEKKRKRAGMFWTEDGRGKKEKVKEKSEVCGWMRKKEEKKKRK